MPQVNKILEILLPILIGAGIGFFTNYLAVKMLFRPLKAIYIGSWRIPMTPGVFPRQRADLAESLGNMVSKELMNPETIRSYLNSDEMKGKIRVSVDSFTEQITNIPIVELIEKIYIPENTLQYLENNEQNIIKQIEKLIQRIMVSVDYNKVSHTLVDDIIIYLQNTDDAQLIKQIYKGLHKWGRKRLDQVFSPAIMNFVRENFIHLFNLASNIFFRWTNQKDVRSSINSESQILLTGIIKNLNIVQQILINVTSYDSALSDKVPGIVDSLLKDLKKRSLESDTAQSITESMESWFNEHQGKSIRSLVKAMDIDVKASVSSLVGYLKDNQAWVQILKDSVKQNKNKITLHEGIASNLAKHLYKNIIQFSKGFDRSNVTSLADVLDLNIEQKEQVNLFFYDSFIRLVDEGISVALKAFDVKALVVKKVNELKMEELEELLLGLMKKQLVYINWLGAFLGGLIGGIQVFL